MASTQQNRYTSILDLPRISLPISERRLLLVIVDALLVNGAIMGSLALWCAVDHTQLTWSFVAARWRWFPALTLTWWVLGLQFDLYDLMVSSRRLVVLRQVALTLGVLLAGYLVVYFFMPPSIMPRLFLFFFVLMALAALGLWRVGYESLLTAPPLRRRTLIVGAGWAGAACAALLQEHGRRLFEVVGFVDDDAQKGGTEVAGLPVLGTSAELLTLTQKHRVEKIVIAITKEVRGELFQALVGCRGNGVTLMRFPNLSGALTKQVPVEHIDVYWALDALDESDTTDRLDKLVRRLLDLVCVVGGLVVLGGLLPFIGLSTWLDDRGPLFYTQVRSGKGGRPFRVIKFRTMRPDAEEDGCPRWASEHDDRITRVGRFLRKTRLDELPQVINVLKRDMHIVGPRPERPAFIEDLERQIPFYRTRLTVKPGLTGWAQIHYEYGNSVEDSKTKLQYDLYYIRHRSIWMDLYVILKTVGVVLSMGGL